MYIRTVKIPSSKGTVNEYVRVVEAYREDGKVKQRVIADLGRKDMLTAMLPKLQQVLLGTPTPEGEDPDAIEVVDAFDLGSRARGAQLSSTNSACGNSSTNSCRAPRKDRPTPIAPSCCWPIG